MQVPLACHKFYKYLKKNTTQTHDYFQLFVSIENLLKLLTQSNQLFVSIQNLFKLLNQSKQSFVSIENLFKLKLTQSNQLFDCLIVSYITGITSYCT